MYGLENQIQTTAQTLEALSYIHLSSPSFNYLSPLPPIGKKEDWLHANTNLTFSQKAGNFIGSPLVQGSLKIFNGSFETFAGTSLALSTWGFAAPIGIPIALHGLNQITAGITTILYQERVETLSSQMLEKMGLNTNNAVLVDDLVTVAGTMFAIGVVRAAAMTVEGMAQQFVKPSVGLGPSKIHLLEKDISNWLDGDTRFIRNKAGDTVFVSKDGLRRVRFDFKNPSPHNNMHSHIECKINGNWVKSGPIYPKDVPKN